MIFNNNYLIHYSSKIYKPIFYTLLATSLTGFPSDESLNSLQRKKTSTNTNSALPQKNATLKQEMISTIWRNLTSEGKENITKWNEKDINNSDGVGLPLLHKLARGGIKETKEAGAAVLKILLSWGVDLHAKDLQGATALYHAIVWKQADLVEELIHVKANVNEWVSEKTLLKIAYDAKNEQESIFGTKPARDRIIGLLIAAGAKITRIKTTLKRGKPANEGSKDSFLYNNPNLITA